MTKIERREPYRRPLLRLLAKTAVLANAMPLARAAAATKPQLKAIAFDAFPIFDPRPLSAAAEDVFPGKGAQLGNVWRSRQFEYQWLRVLSGHYADFWQTTEEALVFSARSLELDLTIGKRAQLMDAYLSLKAWPDAPRALALLKQAGMQLALLSNWTSKMLDTAIRNAGLERVFDHVLSADQVASHKPDPRAYRMAMDAFALEREQILFAAFAGWDAAGAKWFGYPTFWVNRLNAPPEELGVSADASGSDLSELVEFVRHRNGNAGRAGASLNGGSAA
ncbi:MAG TPA: haloacid dehalogenase type II [Burkholderiales bacterium]|nr:haloacid dehalogenase type II [Burkholderiales bacterium]